MKRVMLLLPTTGYRNDDFLAAARTLGVEIAAAANYCERLAPGWGFAPIMALHFDRPQQAAEIVLRDLAHRPDAVLAVDDSGVELAALLAERLGLGGNPPAAVRRVRDKLAFRKLLREQGFRCPEFRHLPSDQDPRSLLPELEFPVVVKARRLSGSRGVIRADDAEAFLQAVERVRMIQSRSDRDARALGIVVESFVPGREYALEGMLERGRLTTLALFDKPDPLDGPYFEETLYVTPSRLPQSAQQAITREIDGIRLAAGLRDGPVHAEVRVNREGVWALEVAARSIGGLCGRALTHVIGMSLEELILRQALGETLAIRCSSDAAGVMMIPTPRRGIFHSIEGLDAARAVPGVSGIAISAEPSQLVAPPPDSAGYLGFIFSRAPTPGEAELALREAYRRLRFEIRAEYPAAVAAAS